MVAGRAPRHRDAGAGGGRLGRRAARLHALSEARAGGLARAGAPGFPAPAPPSPTLVSRAARPCGTRGCSELGRPEARDGGAWSAGRALAWLGDGDERDYSPGWVPGGPARAQRPPRCLRPPSPGTAPGGLPKPGAPLAARRSHRLARGGRGEKEGAPHPPLPQKSRLSPSTHADRAELGRGHPPPAAPRDPLLLGSSGFPLRAAAPCGRGCGRWPDCDCRRRWWRRPPTHSRCSIYRAPERCRRRSRATPGVSSSRLPGSAKIKGPGPG